MTHGARAPDALIFAVVLLDSEIEAGAALTATARMGPFTAKSQALVLIVFPQLLDKKRISELQRLIPRAKTAYRTQR